MPEKIRIVHIALALKEEAFHPKASAPEDEISQLLTDMGIADPDSALADWRYIGARPQTAETIEVNAEMPSSIFGENPELGEYPKSTEEIAKEILDQTKGELPEGALDDLVHDNTANLGSTINNQGPLEQLRFLLNSGLTREFLQDTLKNTA